MATRRAVERALKRLAFATYGARLFGLAAGAAIAPLVLAAGQPHDFFVFACAVAGTRAAFAWSHRQFRAATLRGNSLNVQLEEQDR